MSKTYYEQQQDEIATIKERTITLRLSDADMERIFAKAGEEGITELLQNFVGDLVNGTYSNGSDERDYAQQWFERCWFGGHMEKTFSQFLIQHDQLEDVVGLWSELQMAKDDLLEAMEHPEQCEPEEFDVFEEVIADCSREMNELFSQYRGCESIMPEQEMKSVLEWHRQKTSWLTMPQSEQPATEQTQTVEQLFQPETVDQFRIEAWLQEQGLTSEDIAKVEPLGRDSITLTNPAGQWMVVTCRDGKVEIDQKAERESQKPERHSIRDKLAAAKAECEQRTSKEPQHTSPKLDR